VHDVLRQACFHPDLGSLALRGGMQTTFCEQFGRFSWHNLGAAHVYGRGGFEGRGMGWWRATRAITLHPLHALLPCCLSWLTLLRTHNYRYATSPPSLCSWAVGHAP
jgi:hypothetical protein